LAFGPVGRSQELEPGLGLRVLPATELGLSWELPNALAECDLVHLLDPFSRAGAMALLLTKLHGKPVCASQVVTVPAGFGAALDLLALADAVVPADFTPERLEAVYHALLAGDTEAAR
jgi:hypothetical protein